MWLCLVIGSVTFRESVGDGGMAIIWAEETV